MSPFVNVCPELAVYEKKYAFSKMANYSRRKISESSRLCWLDDSYRRRTVFAMSNSAKLRWKKRKEGIVND